MTLLRPTLLILTALLLAACGSAPQRAATTADSSRGGYLPGDGPGADAPANLDATPDAVPRSEPLHRYANRTYVALGKTYTPLTVAGGFRERGIASWYGKKFHGQRTSSGEVYDMYAMSAAHPVLPIPSYARVTNVGNGKSVVVRINDRGPFLHERVIDLSYTAAHKLGIISNGSALVEIESLTPGTATAPVRQAAVESKPLEESPPPKSAPPITQTVAGGNVYLQLGAFKSQEAAESFLGKMRVQLAEAGKQLNLFVQGGLTRVHLGPYASREEAKRSAEDLQGRLGFKPMVNLR